MKFTVTQKQQRELKVEMICYLRDGDTKRTLKLFLFQSVGVRSCFLFKVYFKNCVFMWAPVAWRLD